jgi:hypothetical protein
VTDHTPDTPAPGPAGRTATVLRMRAIAAGLQAGGLDARVHDTRGVFDIRATVYKGDGKGTDVTVDEDGYVSISYWNDPDAEPAQVIALITGVLTVVTRSS